ncbi:hypothetical protein NEOLI_004068 [Neolecta irregularis DAH-3]|uniref:Cell wall protein RHD3 n=1 Tax=Neolecta irregularis (strain DAH-3) TaxID=1198029 RepID=A0A1U7LU23_NEOID|nr:hypothetical protein NEOLI_004068 [Neolecta irregularis DAH-3]|eukprot:OLL26042.1 hypothetical protein NEOLI_004068 [Neolecta irregularis DAH-3]
MKFFIILASIASITFAQGLFKLKVAQDNTVYYFGTYYAGSQNGYDTLGLATITDQVTAPVLFSITNTVLELASVDSKPVAFLSPKPSDTNTFDVLFTIPVNGVPLQGFSASSNHDGTNDLHYGSKITTWLLSNGNLQYSASGSCPNESTSCHVVTVQVEYVE